MLNIGHEGNAKLQCDTTSLPPGCLESIKQKMTSVGKDRREPEPPYSAGVC